MKNTPNNDTSTATVMVVDDDASTRMIANEFLRQAGFQVVQAADGLQALEAIVDVNPDLLLLDVEMPGMNGFDLCLTLRSMKQFLTLPILMLTGLDNDESIDRAYDVGATDFAAKPINWSLLCHRLKYMLRTSAAEREIHQLAYYDPLTSLANRALFLSKLSQSIESAEQENEIVAVVYFDLDDFKRVNDIFGHATGDELLYEVAQRLNAQVQALGCADQKLFKDVLVARMGGDEFTLLLDRLSSEKAAKVVAQSIIDVFDEPFVLNNHNFFSSPSVGVSIYPEHGRSSNTLLSNADMAMYEAKRHGKNSFRIHNADRDAEIRRHHLLSDRMRVALSEELFTVYYQPQMNLRAGNIYSAEALLRWNDAELGYISPAEFIPIAEENGLIVQLGEWVMRTACQQAKDWGESGFTITSVAVNISVLQFLQAGFTDMVGAILASTGLAPENLELEITESVLASDISTAVDSLRGLKAIGVSLSIDDFGTGYSSLSQLKHYPIDRLKIDKSFIDNVTSNNEDAAITRAIIGMAESMNINVLAEGVETVEQLEFLKRNQCDEIQGFWLSKPETAESLQAAFKSVNGCAGEPSDAEQEQGFRKAG